MGNDTLVDLAKARVTHAGGVIHRGRFVYRDGTAAVWVENRSNHSAQRVLYATDVTYTSPESRRSPHLITLTDGTQWSIVKMSGGCGCGSYLRSYSADDLLAPELETVG